MRKIIGGLLVISLLSRPSLLKIDYIAYEIYKASGLIIKNIRSIQEKTEKEVGLEDVDMAFESIDKNSKGISKLLKDLNNVMGKMNTVMQLKSMTKEVMSEEQVSAFQGFSQYYNEETGVLNETLSTISNKMELKNIKLEIASESTDCEEVYNQLKIISDHQYDAIININKIITAAEDTICVIA